jgi:hypothetical protein
MALRRQRLFHRVANVGNVNRQAMAGYHPAGTEATPHTMPLQHVQIIPTSGGYSTLAYQDITPIWTTDGAAIPGTAPGTWGQLIAAGRP